MLAGQYSGKVRAMSNERGEALQEAGPSTPVSILGLDGAPNAGDEFHIFENEKEARDHRPKAPAIAARAGHSDTKAGHPRRTRARIAVGEYKELNLIIKGDVDGSTEALADSLIKQSTEKVQVNVIHKAVGQISESDVFWPLLPKPSSSASRSAPVAPPGSWPKGKASKSACTPSSTRPSRR